MAIIMPEILKIYGGDSGGESKFRARSKEGPPAIKDREILGGLSVWGKRRRSGTDGPNDIWQSLLGLSNSL